MIRSGISFTVTVAVLSVAVSSTASAQASLKDQKEQADIDKIKAEIAKMEAETRKAEVDREKGISETINTSRAGTLGSATVAAAETSAEGLLLSRHVQERTANNIVTALKQWNANACPRKVVISFNDYPPTTADYDTVKRGFDRLTARLSEANTLAREFYDRSSNTSTAEIKRRLDALQSQLGSVAGAAAIGPVVTAVTTAASLLKVNTSIQGAALPVSNEQYRAILYQRLSAENCSVDIPRSPKVSTMFVDNEFDKLMGARATAAAYQARYLAHLAKVDGKTSGLTPAELLVGASLNGALDDFKALYKDLYTPVGGVLPAAVIQEQKAIADAQDVGAVIYIQAHKASLTSLTKQGAFTGIIGMPAYVSAVSTVDYAFRDVSKHQFGNATYVTPLMKLTGVRAWLKPKAQ
jgi:hypothetical protein